MQSASWANLQLCRKQDTNFEWTDKVKRNPSRCYQKAVINLRHFPIGPILMWSQTQRRIDHTDCGSESEQIILRSGQWPAHRIIENQIGINGNLVCLLETVAESIYHYALNGLLWPRRLVHSYLGPLLNSIIVSQQAIRIKWLARRPSLIGHQTCGGHSQSNDATKRGSFIAAALGTIKQTNPKKTIFFARLRPLNKDQKSRQSITVSDAKELLNRLQYSGPLDNWQLVAFQWNAKFDGNSRTIREPISGILAMVCDRVGTLARPYSK